MRALLAAAFLACLCLPAAAQQENTVEDWSWTVDHYEQKGMWISACDHRDDNGKKLERCYLSVVDVYSPRPLFGAAFVFLTPPTPETLKFEFRFERGVGFEDGGFAIRRDGQAVWTYDTERCPDLKCLFEGEEAAALAATLSQPGELRLAFTDKFFRSFERIWPNEGFAEMLADFRAAKAERGL